MDPFGGTGTVAAAAKANGHHFIHIDQSEKYCKAAQERVRKIEVIPEPPIRRSAKIAPPHPREPMLFVRSRAIPQT